MTKHLPCPPAPGPPEEYAAKYEDRLGTLAQQRGFREHPQGLLLPRDRHKTLTGLVGTEPIVGGAGAVGPAAPVLRLRIALGCRGNQPSAAGIAGGRSRDGTVPSVQLGVTV